MYNLKRLLLAMCFLAMGNMSLNAGECSPDIYTRKDTPITQLAVFNCAVKALGDHDRSEVCLRDRYKLGQACARCFADFTTCAYENCTGMGSPCGIMGINAFSRGCGNCVMQICTDTFMQCSGLESLPPSKH